MSFKFWVLSPLACSPSGLRAFSVDATGTGEPSELLSRTVFERVQNDDAECARAVEMEVSPAGQFVRISATGAGGLEVGRTRYPTKSSLLVGLEHAALLQTYEPREAECCRTSSKIELSEQLGRDLGFFWKLR
jgi:hypothetical protein